MGVTACSARHDAFLQRCSRGTASWKAFLPEGGIDGNRDIFRRDDANGMEKGKCFRVYLPQECRLMHQAADCKVGHHEPIELLLDEVRGLAAQDDSRTAQVGLELVECRLDLPRS